MSHRIHASAIVDSSAHIAEEVIIGPWVTIGKNVTIGRGTQIISHAVIGDHTIIGENNRIYPHVSLGLPPQISDHDPSMPTWLEIGDDNIIREFTSMNCGSAKERGVTRVGSHNYFMNYTHVAHDCVVGNHNTFVNSSGIAGHVRVHDYVTLGAYVGVHQFCQIGAYSFIGRAAKVYQNILPYVLAAGNPCVPSGLNNVGLRRLGFTREQRAVIKSAYRLLHRRDIKFSEICQQLREMAADEPLLAPMLAMADNSPRGIARANKEQKERVVL